jgi:hypothetical protein
MSFSLLGVYPRRFSAKPDENASRTVGLRPCDISNKISNT